MTSRQLEFDFVWMDLPYLNVNWWQAALHNLAGQFHLSSLGQFHNASKIFVWTKLHTKATLCFNEFLGWLPRRHLRRAVIAPGPCIEVEEGRYVRFTSGYESSKGEHADLILYEEDPPNNIKMCLLPMVM